MRVLLGLLIGAFVGAAVFYQISVHFACRATPDNNLCGLPAMLFAAPLGAIVGAVIGGVLARPKKRARV